MTDRSLGSSRLVAWAGLLALTLAACSMGTPGGPGGSTASAGAEGASAPVTLRLGYFPNVTHATAIVGVEKGIFADHLPANVTLEPSSFNAGPAAIEAIFSDALDATYIGPNPAINAFARSDGEAIRIVSGATSGGAFLVVSPEITTAADLRGKTVASPQLGNTQDVALRAWLTAQGYTVTEDGGDVTITPQDNAQTLETFRDGQIAGAWVPEPWATRLIKEGGGHVLVDERDLWPGGKYVTTHLIVRTAYLEQHPDVVKALLEGHAAANDFVNESPSEAQQLTNQGIEKITGKKLADEILAAAWKNLTFTDDPLASSLVESAADAAAVGLTEPVDLAGIYELTLLNEVLVAAGKPEVSDQ
jgi:NitT/TauT family transport system substrate-binding protein